MITSNTSLCEKAFPRYADYIKKQLVPGRSLIDLAHTKVNSLYIAYFRSLIPIPAAATILDLGCNTGNGIRVWHDNGYANVHGIDINPQNIHTCLESGLQGVYCADAENLSFMSDDTYDVVYTTHTLEHMYSPSKTVCECRRILKPNGHLLVVLPYPAGDSPEHLGSIELGTCQAPNMANSTPYDDGASVMNFFKKHGFLVLDKKYDSFREPEIWLSMRKGGEW